jgi:phosphohistidine phosphatase
MKLRESGMRLYVIRHAEAVAQGQDGIERDEDRPLTAAGKEQSRRLAQALRHQGVALDKLLTSPLKRARETAEGMLAAWGDGAPALAETEALTPGAKKKKLIRELLATGGEAVAIVGHNPDLSELIGWLIGEKNTSLSLAKAGIACIDFDGSPCKECGTLAWLVSPEWYG